MILVQLVKLTIHKAFLFGLIWWWEKLVKKKTNFYWKAIFSVFVTFFRPKNFCSPNLKKFCTCSASFVCVFFVVLCVESKSTNQQLSKKKKMSNIYFVNFMQLKIRCFFWPFYLISAPLCNCVCPKLSKHETKSVTLQYNRNSKSRMIFRIFIYCSFYGERQKLFLIILTASNTKQNLKKKNNKNNATKYHHNCRCALDA